MISYVLLKRRVQISLIVFIGVVLRLICIPFFQGVDADGTSRILIAERLIDSPEFFTHGVWLPLHHYLNAFAILLSGEHIISPVLVNILLASFTAIPIFYFSEREFSYKGAWLAALLFVLSPVFFRNSFHALSGVPYAFFIAWSLNWLSLSLKLKSVKYAVLSGLMITIASGIRYESWLVIALFTLVYCIKKSWSLMGFFWLVAMIFPSFWMIGNFIENGDLFSGLTGAYDWNIGMEGINDSVSLIKKLKRLLYFPFSWFFMMSPFICIPLFYIIITKFKARFWMNNKLIWLFLFIVIFMIFIYKSFVGTLLNQHRFTQSLILFSVPFTALLVDGFSKCKYSNFYLIGSAISILPLSYFWMIVPYEKALVFSESLKISVKEIRLTSLDTFNALPRLENQGLLSLEKDINSNLNISSGVVLDFESWENTFYLGAHSNVKNENLVILGGAKNEELDPSRIIDVLERTKQGVILLNKVSKFSEKYEVSGNQLRFLSDKSFNLKLELIKRFDGIELFKYKYTQSRFIKGEDPIFSSFSSGSIQFMKLKIKQNSFWYRDIKYIANINKTSIEKELENAAQYQVNILR